MKHFSPLLLFLMAGCGILEMLFPIEYPQRYIAREVDRVELVGRWEITPDSKTRITDYFKQAKSPHGLAAPWRSITLNEDGRCEVDLEILWDVENDVLKEPDALPTCTWKLDSILGYDETGSFKDVPGLFIRFEHHNKGADRYEVYYSESYLVEENNELVLWNFIGDLAYFRYQDFKKVKE